MKNNLMVLPPPESEPPPDDEWEPTDADAPDAPAESEQPSARSAVSIEQVLASWEQHGPLVHEPTGIRSLDEHTGGGPVYGSRWYLLGAPDAGKTAMELQIAHDLARRGVAVGLLAADEEAGDLVTRLVQRIGYARHHCEARDGAVLAEMGVALRGLPIRFYDASWTIEAAASDLAGWAKLRADADPGAHPHGPRAFLGIDSIQTVQCAADAQARLTGRELSEVTAVTARVHAIRDAATRHRLIALATSEMGRGAYRSSDPSQQTSTLASAKWSGAIEYSGRVVLGLRSVIGEKDLVEVELAKNKHGPRDVKVHLRIDRHSQTLTETVYDAPPEASAGERRAASTKAAAVGDAAAVLATLESQPGLNVRQLRAAMRLAAGLGVERVETALSLLGDAVVRTPGPHKSVLLSINPSKVPPEATGAQ